MIIHLKTKYINESASLQFLTYFNGRPCLIAYSLLGEPISKLTINVPELPLEEDEVVIKTYSENEGTLECLVANQVVSEPIRYVHLNYIQAPICRLLIPRRYTT